MLYSWYFIKMAWWLNNMNKALAMCHQLLVCICAFSPFEQSSSAQCSRGYSLDSICAQASCLCFVLRRLCVHNPAPLLCAYCYLHSGWHRRVWILEEICHYDCKIWIRTNIYFFSRRNRKVELWKEEFRCVFHFLVGKSIMQMSFIPN